MKKYICSICGYVYDEAKGIPDDGIPPGTKRDDLPDGWVCPDCGAPKVMFDEDISESVDGVLEETVTVKSPVEDSEIRGLSFGEMSALCSNLSKGCEKQYRPEESELFGKLAEYFDKKAGVPDGKEFKDISDLIQQDLNTGFIDANKVVAKEMDRGALRALVWGEKVTKIIKTVLMRYDKNGTGLLKETNIFVCEICGFVYIGDEPPERCPVCKVPNMKIAKVRR